MIIFPLAPDQIFHVKLLTLLLLLLLLLLLKRNWFKWRLTNKTVTGALYKVVRPNIQFQLLCIEQCNVMKCPKLVEGLSTSISYTLQRESKNPPPPCGFLTIFSKWLEISNQFLHIYYTFLYILDNKFLFNYFQLSRSYAILLSVTTERSFTFH